MSIESVPPNLITAYAQALLACRAALKALKKCQCTDHEIAEAGSDAIIELEHALDMAKGKA